MINHNRSHILCTKYQEYLYLHWKHNRFSDAYHMSFVYEIKGELDISLFLRTLKNIVEGQFSFGLKFKECANHDVTCTYDPSCQPVIDHHTITGNDNNLVDYELELHKSKFFLKPFDLEKGRTFYIDMVRTENSGTYYLLLNCHHIIADTYSFHKIMHRLSDSYNNMNISNSKDISFTADEYIILNKRERALHKSAEEFTNMEISRDRPLDTFSIDLSIKEHPTFDILAVNKHIRQEIQRFCQKKNITPAIFFLGCHKIFLNQVFKKEHLLTGTINDNRGGTDYDELAGYFVNISPLRSRINEETTIDSLFNELKIKTQRPLKMNSSMRSPFGSKDKFLPGYPATYDNIFSYHTETADCNLSKCKVNAVPVHKKHLLFPFSITVEDCGEGTVIRFSKDGRILPGSEFLDVFLKIITEMLNQENRTITQLSKSEAHCIPIDSYADYVIAG